ncbi:ABC transporter permease [Caenimonas aquaedulcis]|uniref:ABC transporter permease n=1 Tax=Caenimonas aquaedulcis TaxID=2793270 RepID=A0A931H7X9_9BURK|nr:ABC transporter permease [Caenimonas aquaedulcis]MBG9390052.1 ABC transporter permease [Caenimonas aquaedulcis]
MTTPLLLGLLAGAILSGTSLLYATLGEAVVERSGIVNLGLEGVLLVGASSGFAVTAVSGNAWLGLLTAAAAGALMNMLFGWLVVTRKANQLASGLTLMFFGFGASALIGAPHVGAVIAGLPKWRPQWLAGFDWVRASTLFNYDLLTWLALPAALLTWWLLFATRWGLGVRAVGEMPAAAFAAGRDTAHLQYQALLLGGALGGIAGAHLSLSLTLTWAEYMTAGRGFIAIALVIFSKWNPLRAIAGALLFGGAEAMELQLQARGSPISPFVLHMLPYLLTLGVLLAWGGSRRLAAPASLGRTFYGSS